MSKGWEGLDAEGIHQSGSRNARAGADGSDGAARLLSVEQPHHCLVVIMEFQGSFGQQNGSMWCSQE